MFMAESAAIPAPRSATARELAAVLLLLVAVGSIQLALGGAFSLFGRHFWLDELYTQRLVADPQTAHMLRALRGGVETHPPTFYLLVRAFTQPTGQAGETALRSLALAAVLAALVGTYAVLRLAFPPLVALAAVLALGSHPLVQRHAFEARAYGSWLAAAVWFAYAAARALQPGAAWPALLLLGATAVLLCTLHYFGIITLALVLAAACWWDRSAGRARRWTLLAAAAGPLALAGCVPFLLGQRGATTVPTWVKSPDLGNVGRFLLSVLFPRHLLVLLPVAAVLGWLLRTGRQAAPRAAFTGAVALASLALLPLVLIVFSFTVQSALVDRYALPATAALAPLAALLAARLSRPWLLGFCLLLIASGTLNLHDLAQQYQERDRQTDDLIASIRHATGKELIVFEQPHELQQVCYYAPDLASRCVLLDFEPGQFGPVPPSRVFNRDLARKFAAFYGQPALVRWDELKSRPRWDLVVEGGRTGRELPDREAYPGFVPRRLDVGLYQLNAERAPD